MRQTSGIVAVLAAMTALAGYAVAPEVPNWDWQATFVFNGSGEVTSSTLDFSSSNWVTCGGGASWVNTIDTSTSTSNMTHMEKLRVDSLNKMKGKLIQENGNVRNLVYLCALGAQIQLDFSGPPSGCHVPPSVYGGCAFSCDAGDDVVVDVTAGIALLAEGAHASCGGAQPSCYPDATTLACVGNATAATSYSNPNFVTNCQVGLGLWAVVNCRS